MILASSPMIDCLRAAGEPTRLRVLSLLRQRDLSVGELVQVLEQSQPRLSHHLKALTAAGLVERLPEGSFVFYRAATRGAGKAFLDALFAQLDPEEADFVRDRQHLEEVSATRADTAEAYFSSIAENWDRLRSLHYPNDLIESALLEL
ncbi:MAG TPA: ArsR family transcriptional regulator, partial [Hyphomonas atlantica]|nr:ArsR family transcriptional regulator [Hyphomonas atlantica]